jgi:hypothetical protein
MEGSERDVHVFDAELVHPVKKKAGVTLLEVVIGSVIMTAVVFMSIGILVSTSAVLTSQTCASALEERGIRFLGVCREDLSTARFAGTITVGGSSFNLGIPTPSYNTGVGYRVPGSRDASGKSLTLGTIAYGYVSPLQSPMTGFYQDLACFLRFEADSSFLESSNSPIPRQALDWGAPFPAFPELTPQILNLDLNGDGDTTDSFVRGRLVRYVLAQTSTNASLVASHPSSAVLGREVLSDNVLLRVAGTAAGQFDADVEGHALPATSSGVLVGFVGQSGLYRGGAGQGGVDNTNVATDGLGLLVTLWHAVPDDQKKRFILRSNKILIRFRSPQS